MFKRNDYVVAIASILLGIFILIQSAQLNETVKVSIDPAGPTALPNLMAYIIILMGILHIVGSLYAKKVIEKTKSQSLEEFFQQYKAIFYVTIVCLIYAIFMEAVGYLILTPVLIGSLLWIVQVRDLKLITKASLVMTTILFVVFRFGLKVKFPLGFLDIFFG